MSWKPVEIKRPSAEAAAAAGRAEGGKMEAAMT